MSSPPSGLRGMCWAYFASFRADGSRLISWWRVILLGVLPLTGGIAFASRLGTPSYSSLQVFVAVLAVLAAVLVGLLPLMHSVLGQVDGRRLFAPGETPLADAELNRVRVIQDLHAAVSWAVVLLVLALGFAALTVFLPGYIPLAGDVKPMPQWSFRAQLGCSVFLYTVACSTGLSFLDIASGVFEAVENHAENIKRTIDSNIDKTRK